MTKIYIILTLLTLLLSFSCTDRVVYEEVSDYEDLIPVFAPPGGTYHNVQNITITTKVEGATIRFTIDGSEPGESATTYTGSIHVSMPTTIKAKASKPGWYAKSSTAEYLLRTATPTFNPQGGGYHDQQRVTINCATEGATIRYTTDGNDPTTSSAVYSVPIDVDGNITLKARGFKENWTASDITQAEYSFTVSTPTFNPPGGGYFEPQRVTINCATEGATIRYTTNGSEPTTSSAVYSVPIDVPLGTTLKAKGFKEGWTSSQTSSAQYSIYVPEGMVFVEGGTFNPSGNYTVTLSSFYIARYVVTQSEYQSVMGTNPSHFSGNPNRPVEVVNWFNAIEYCNRLSIREELTPAYSYSTHGTNPANWPSGWSTSNANHTNVSCNWNADGYRLPTEMEWEFAARGGVPAKNVGTFNHSWAGTNVEAQLVNYAWYSANSGSRTRDVGTKAPNELGLYDMNGNVWEWNWDIHGSYPTGLHNDPRGASSGSYRVYRGGSWDNSAGLCTVSVRNNYTPSPRGNDLGFRCVRRVD